MEHGGGRRGGTAGLCVGQTPWGLWTRLSCGRMAGWRLPPLTWSRRLPWQESQLLTKKPAAFPRSRQAQPCFHGVTTPGFPTSLYPSCFPAQGQGRPTDLRWGAGGTTPWWQAAPVSDRSTRRLSAAWPPQQRRRGARSQTPVMNPCSQHCKSEVGRASHRNSDPKQVKITT